MASGVGSSPFNGGSIDVRNPSEADALRAHYKENKHRRKTYTSKGLAINSGFMKKPEKPPSKKIMGANGKWIRTPDVIDWDDWLDIFTIKSKTPKSELYKQHPEWKNCQNLADIASYSFEKTSWTTVDCKYGGHILRFDYAPYTQVLRTYFRSDGDPVIVCYFYVPKAVYNTLAKLAGSSDTRPGEDGKRRHLVGIYFWNLIRVRGTIHGNRYACCYVSGGGGYTRRPKMRTKEYVENVRKDIKALEEQARSLDREGHHEEAAELSREAADMKESLEREMVNQIEDENMVSKASGKSTGEAQVKSFKEIDKSVGMTADQMARRDAWYSHYHEDPEHPIALLTTKKWDTGVTGLNETNALIALMLDRARTFLSGDSASYSKFISLGSWDDNNSDEDMYSGYIRQEQYLVEKGLWPPLR